MAPRRALVPLPRDSDECAPESQIVRLDTLCLCALPYVRSTSFMLVSLVDIDSLLLVCSRILWCAVEWSSEFTWCCCKWPAPACMWYTNKQTVRLTIVLRHAATFPFLSAPKSYLLLDSHFKNSIRRAKRLLLANNWDRWCSGGRT